MQWGEHVNSKAETDGTFGPYTVTFPLKYSSTPYTITATPMQNSNNRYPYHTGWHVISKTSSTFTYTIGGEQQADSLLWMCIG